MTARRKVAGSRRAVRAKKIDEYRLPAWRYRLATFGISALGLLLVGRIATLQVLPDMEQGYEFLQSEGDARTIRYQKIPAYRGSILDRNGRPLAVSTSLVDIVADPALVRDDQIAELAEVVGLSEAEFRAKLELYSDKRYMRIKRELSPEQAQPIVKAGFAGVVAEEIYRRFYPDAEILAQTLGLIDYDKDRGVEGLEAGYEDWLAGKSGRQRMVVDRFGRVVDYLDQVSPVDPGKDLNLTIDMELQYLAYKALKSAFIKYRAASASIVVMDPKTGEVLALASQPSFNPNNRENIEYSSMRNGALADHFEPGSTVKPFTMLAAIESGKYSPSSTIETSPGYIRVDGKFIKDFRNYETLDLTGVLANSSQVGTVKVALSLDEELIFDTFRRVGFGESAAVGFPGELSGSLPYISNWTDLLRANFSYGYGISATTLQLAQAYSVLANDGLRVYPSLVQGVSKPDPERVASKSAVQQVKAMMREVVEHGTGALAALENYSVAGKTGTGHLVGDFGYEDHRYSSLFAGFAPADDPKLVIAVVINDPKGEDYFGGLVAAPVFSEVMGNALRALNVPGDQEGVLLGANP